MEWISILSLFFSICACIVPVVIYFKEKKDRKAELEAELRARKSLNKQASYHWMPNDIKEDVMAERVLQEKLKG